LNIFDLPIFRRKKENKRLMKVKGEKKKIKRERVACAGSVHSRNQLLVQNFFGIEEQNFLLKCMPITIRVE
jgi:hypothetical protein